MTDDLWAFHPAGRDVDEGEYGGAERKEEEEEEGRAAGGVWGCRLMV